MEVTLAHYPFNLHNFLLVLLDVVVEVLVCVHVDEEKLFPEIIHSVSQGFLVGKEEIKVLDFESGIVEIEREGPFSFNVLDHG